VQSDPTIIDSLHYQGYWHVGGDTIGAFAVKPSSGYLAGDVADVAVYAQALSADQVSSHSVCC
jgi:hypothetical protein